MIFLIVQDSNGENLFSMKQAKGISRLSGKDLSVWPIDEGRSLIIENLI